MSKKSRQHKADLHARMVGILCVVRINIAYYYGGSGGIFSFLFVTGVLFLPYSIILLGRKWIRKKKRGGRIRRVRTFLLRCWGTLSLLTLLVVTIIRYHNTISPAKITQYTITNNNKIVVFQSMAHIATQSFYDEVQKEVQEYKDQDYVLFYEGITGGDQESREKLNEILGIRFNEEIYAVLATLYNMTAQNNNDFLTIGKTKDYNVDLSVEELITQREELTAHKNQESQDIALLDPSSIILLFDSLTSRQQELLITLNKAIMNILLKSLMNGQMNAVLDTDTFQIILNKRDEHLAQTIAKSQEEKIIVLYGALHFSGTFAQLQENNNNRSVIHKKDFFPTKD